MEHNRHHYRYPNPEEDQATHREFREGDDEAADKDDGEQPERHDGIDANGPDPVAFNPFEVKATAGTVVGHGDETEVSARAADRASSAETPQHHPGGAGRPSAFAVQDRTLRCVHEANRSIACCMSAADWA